MLIIAFSWKHFSVVPRFALDEMMGWGFTEFYWLGFSIAYVECGLKQFSEIFVHQGRLLERHGIQTKKRGSR